VSATLATLPAPDNQTLEYNAELQRAAAQTKKSHIIRQLMAGQDPLAAGLDYREQALASVNRVKMARPLMTPDEILRMPEDRQILFVSGIDCPPIAAWRRKYFLLRELAGKFMPNPLHNERDGYVRVPTRWGLRWRRVVTEPVPPRFAGYPQFQHNGLISYIEGYRPF
jgi:type IV secretion system protein VirD4